MNTKTEPCKTLGDAYRRYSDSFPDKAARVGTAILRYLLPYKGFKFDFQIYPGQMLNPEIKAKGMKFLNQIALEDLSEIEHVLVWQAEVFDVLKVSQYVRRPNKHYLKSFLMWCKDQEWLEKSPEEWEVPQSLPETSKAYHRRGGRERHHIYNRQPLIKYGASLNLVSDTVKHQLEEWKNFWINVNYEGTRPLSKLVELDTHQKLLDRFSYFLGWLTLDKLKYHRQMYDRSQQKKEKDPNYESFWLTVSPEPPDWLQEMHKKYPPRSLDSITLEEFIPIIEIRPDKLQIDESHPLVAVDSNRVLLQIIQEELKHQNATLSFDTIAKLGQVLLGNQAFSEEIIKLNKINERESAKQKANMLMEETCKHIRSHLKSFFRWLQYQHNPSGSPQGYRISPNYRTSFCDVFLNLAKFLYKDITNPRKFPDYEDIGIISELRSLIKEELNAEFKPNPVNPVKRNPTWLELGNLLKELLVACAPRRKISSDSERVSLGPMRRQATVAVDFQKYLIMMFFRVVSPERQHVIRQLKQHDTLRLCWINQEAQEYEEAPWDEQNKQYKAFYHPHTRLYYLDLKNVKDEKGNFVKKPQGKAFAWIVFLDATQTKIDQENAYRIPKIYNSELEAWLNGREDYSETWFNWPKLQGSRNNKWSKKQHHWCGYVDLQSGAKSGFRKAFNSQHDYVFTTTNGKPFTVSNMCRLYDAILWRHLGIRSNPHAVRSAATGHFKRKGMTDVEKESLAKIKSHSVKTQDSPAYNKLAALEKTERASEMLVNDFLEQHGLDPEKYGLA